MNGDKRLFAGISVPKNAQLVEAVSKMKKTAAAQEIDVKWMPPENWHVTVWFFGNTSPDKIGAISDALKKAAGTISPFELDLKGFGAFADPREARVIWAGVNRPKELVTLRENVLSELQTDIGEEHDYLPHVTVGRLKNTQSVTSLIEPVARRNLFSFTVRELVLFESVMQNYIPKYTKLESFGLR